MPTSQSEIQRIFNLMQSNEKTIASTGVKERRRKLGLLLNVIASYKEEARRVLYSAFGKPPAEVDLIELFAVTSEIKHARRNLSDWMRGTEVSTPIHLLGASSSVVPEAKGVSLIISPWNFPIQLSLGPLVSAICAGCPVIIKPSEATPEVGRLIKKMLAEVFEENEVAVVEGGVETATYLLELPFQHIFFTGSPRIGKIVMQAAAKHLTSVTLELGGKNPNIVDRSANIRQAARRTVMSKFTNAGQICISPDYVLVHQEVKDQFINELKRTIQQFYGTDAAQSSSYTRIVNDDHLSRLQAALQEAVEQGARVEYGGTSRASDRYLAPTILTDLPENCQLLTEEVFGPILPIISFKDREEVVALISRHPKPLALYVYAKNKKNIKYYLNETTSGGAVVNFGAIHFFNPHLPFGGVNHSGIGKSHGHYGFLAFSNQRAVLRQHTPAMLELLSPPYNQWKQKLIDFTLRWF